MTIPTSTAFIPAPRSGDLITPTGVLLSTADPETEAWYAVRRAGITATDLPKILGLSKYGDARTVWHDKLGELQPEPAGEAALWGHLLEDVVARRVSEMHGFPVRRIGILGNRDAPWMRAALDRLVDACPLNRGLCGLEIKTRSAFTAGRWRDEMPDDVLAQVAWQRIVSGVDHVHIAALIGGQRLVEYTYEADTDLEGFLVEQAEKLWAQVQSREVPLVEPTQILADMLDRLFPHRAGDVELDEGTAMSLVNAYRQTKALEDEAASAKEALRAHALDLLGPGENLTLAGDAVFTYREQTRRSIAVAALKKKDADLYAALNNAGHISEKTSRVLRFAYKGDSK